MYAVLFDLDDTLYPEISYVKSGFGAVARFLATDRATQAKLLAHMLELFACNPSGVFERLLERVRGVDLEVDVSSEIIPKLVDVYRSHSPTIRLYDDVLPTLRVLRQYGIRLGIITDGRADGQQAKVEALGVAELVDVVVITDSLGPKRRYWKPHSRPFEVALSELDVRPANAVYIGDNPTKDFHGPAQLGMRTVHVRRPDALKLFAREKKREESWLHGDYDVDDLRALLRLLKEWAWLGQEPMRNRRVL